MNKLASLTLMTVLGLNKRRLLRLMAMLFISQPSFAQDSFSFENLVETIKTNNLKSIESTLPFFPEAMRLNFVLMSRSASSQGADPFNPRVILFGKDAKLIVAFNGSSKQKGFNKLEIIQFRESTKSFEFREIDFSTGIVSEKNPSRCLACHTSDSPRPNWAHYSRWVMGESQAYGFQDDYLHNPELEMFKMFKASQPSHERYKALLFRSGSSQSPFLKTGDNKGNLKFRPNLKFTRKLLKLNAQRNAYKLKTSLGTSYPLYRSIILDIFITLKQIGYSHKDYRDIQALADQILKYGILSPKELQIIDSAKAGYEKLNLISAILLRRSGIKPWDLDMNFLADRKYDANDLESYNSALNYIDGFASIYEGICEELLKELSLEYPELNNLIPVETKKFLRIRKILGHLNPDFIPEEDSQIVFHRPGDAEKFDEVLRYVRKAQLGYSESTTNQCQAYLNH